MQMRSLALALALTWALTGCAHSLSFEDGYAEGWAEQHGPQFVFAFSEQDIDTMRRAFAKLEDEHLKYPDGIDDYLMGRRARMLHKFDSFDYLVLAPEDGKVWRLQPMSLLEMALTGFAVSRDRYCRAEDQDVGEMEFLAAGVECYIRNTRAIALYERLEKTRHMTPGGKE